MESRADIEKSVYIAKSLGFVPILVKGKIPLLKNWQNKTLEDCRTFKSAKPGINIGVLTGKPSGIIVLDIEHYEVEAWKNELKDHPDFPKTLTVATGRKGLHIYFNYSEEVEKLKNAVKRPYDLKTSGGQCVFLYSRTENQYLPIEGFSTKPNGEIIVDIADMPQWLINKFLKQLK